MDWSFGYIFTSMIISLLGISFFMYGKKAQRLWPLLAGIAMSIYPWFIYDVWILWGVTVAVMGFVFWMRER